MSSVKPARPKSDAQLKRLLLGGTAICGALAVAGSAVAAPSLPSLGAALDPTKGGAAVTLGLGTTVGLARTTAATVASSPTYGINTAGTTGTVTLNDPRTIINWNSYDVSGATLNYSYAGSNGIVVNRLDSGQMRVETDGTVNAPGLQVWFLANDGVFLNGTVTASGILAIPKIDFSGAGLDPLTATAGQLAAASNSFISINGVVTATGATANSDGSITLTGGVTASGASISLQSASGKDITLGSPINAGTGDVNLTSGGAITQTGAIIASTLETSASTGISLDAGNQITTVNSLTNTASGDLVFKTAGTFDIAGQVSNSGSNGDVSLTSGGAITESTGSISASTFSATAAGGISLNGSNQITTVNLLTNTTSGDLVFDSNSITLAGTVSNTGSGVVTLGSGGTITQSSGAITSTSFSASATGGINLIGGNAITGAGALSNTGSGDIVINTFSGVNLGGTVSNSGSGVFTLTASGAVTETGGAINAPTLSVTATGGINLTGSNQVTTVDGLSNSGDGDIVFTNAGSVNFRAVVTNSAPVGGVLLTTTAGDITAGTVSANGDVSVNAAGDANVFSAIATDDIRVRAGHTATLQSATINAGPDFNFSATDSSDVLDGKHQLLVQGTSGQAILGGSGQSVSIASDRSSSVSLSSNLGVIVGLANASYGGGTLTFDSLSSTSGQVTVNLANGDIAIGTLSGTGASLDAADLTPGQGTISVSAPSFNGDSYSVTGQGFLSNTLKPVFGGLAVDFSIELTKGSLTLGPTDLTTPNRDLSIKVDSGDLTAASLTAGRSVTVNAVNGAAVVTTATAGGDLTVDGANGATLRAASFTGSASHALQISSATGPAVLGADEGTTATAPNTVSLSGGATGADVTVQTTAGSGDVVVNLDTAPAQVTLDTLSSFGGSVSATYSDLNPALGAISINNATAQQDIAIRSVSGSVSLSSGTAGDDIAIRAAGAVSLGTLQSGVVSHGVAVDGSGPADTLASTPGLQNTIFGLSSGPPLTGHDIDVVAASITATGLVKAGRPGLASGDPDYADQAGSDVRFLATSGAITTAAVQAYQDVGLDARATGDVTTNNLTASRDVAVRSATGTVQVNGSSSAGDDDVFYAWRALNVTGDISSGQTQLGVPASAGGDASPPIGDPNVALGDQLADLAGMEIFDGVKKSVSGGHDVLLMASRVLVSGNITAGGAILSSASPDYSTQVGSNVAIVANGADGGGASLTLQGVSANQDIGLDAVGAVSTLDLSAGRDVAVRSQTANLSIASATAGDDVVLRAPLGAVRVTGPLSSGQSVNGAPSDDTAGMGDQLAALDAPGVTLFGAPMTLTTGGHDINIAASGQAQVDGTISAGQASYSGADGVNQFGSNLSISAGSIQLNLAAGANQDIGLDAATGSVNTLQLNAGRDIAVRAASANLTILSATAGDDVVLRAPAGGVNVGGALSSGQSVRGAAFDDTFGYGDQLASLDAAGVTLFGAPMTLTTGGHEINIAASGLVQVGGTISAGQASYSGPDSTAQSGSALRISAGSIDLTAAAGANQDIGLDASGGVNAGDLSAGRDVAARSQTSNLTIASAGAGDDVVLRALSGVVTVNGGGTAMSTGRTVRGVAPADVTGLADTLAGLDASTVFGVSMSSVAGGHDIDIAGMRVKIQGEADAGGTIPATTDPDYAAQVGSNIRMLATGSDAAPGAEAIHAGALSANQDIGLDATRAAGSVSAADLSAGRDVAVRSVSSNVTLASAAAGDDVVLRAPAAAVTVSGALSSGQTVNGAPFDDTAGLSDQLASLDAPGVTLFGAPMTLTTGGHEINIAASSLVQVDGAINAGQASYSGADGLAQFGSNLSISAGSIQLNLAAGANQDIGLDAATGPVNTLGLNAGRDIAVRAAGANLTIASATAGDDVVLRAPAGGVTVGGALSSGQSVRGAAFDDTFGYGDQLASLDAAGVTLFGAPMTLTTGGHEINIAASGQVQVSGIIDAGQASYSGSDSATQLGSSLRISAGSIHLTAAAGANQDIGLDATGAVNTSALSAGRDVAVRSQSSDINIVPSIAAGDDIVLRAPAGNVSVNNALSSGQTSSDADHTVRGAAFDDGASGLGDQLAALAPISIFDLADTPLVGGHTIDIGASGSVFVGGAINAGQTLYTGSDASTQFGSDLRVSANSISVGAAGANHDIGLDGAGVSAASLSAGGDAAVRATGADIFIGSIEAGDDIALRAPNGSVSIFGSGTALTSGQAVRGAPLADASGFADTLASSDGATVFGAPMSSVAGGHDINIAGLQVSISGAVVAGGTIPATSDPDYAAQLGSNVRIQATGSDVDGDPTLSVKSVSANQDIGLDGAGTSGSVASQNLTAGRDVAVRSVSAGVMTWSVQAGDDIVLRAGSTIWANGTLTSGVAFNGATFDDTPGLGDQLALIAPMSLFGGADTALTGGHNIDLSAAELVQVDGAINAGQASYFGSDAAAQFGSGLRISAGSIKLNGAAGANRDIGLDAAGTVTSGALSAGRDVAARSQTAGLTIASAQAGDDVVLRTTSGDITVAGALTAGHAVRGAASADTPGLGDQLYVLAKTTLNTDLALDGANVDLKSASGRISVGGATNATADARFQSGGAINVGGVTAGRDILADGPSATTGTLSAGRDIALRAMDATGPGVTVNGPASAGDDIAVRSAATVNVAGKLTTGTGPDGLGVADQLAATSGIGALSFAVPTSLSGGGDLDIVSTNEIEITDQSSAGASAQLQSQGGITLPGLTAVQDILIDVTTNATIAGDLTAGRDIGVRSGSGSLTLASAQAGGDIVLRAQTGVTVNGVLTTTGKSGGGAGPVAQMVFNDAPTSLNGAFTLSGSDIDVATKTGAISVSGAVSAAGDARLQTSGTTGAGVTTANVSAGGDVLLDGTSVAAGALNADGDIALRGRTGAVSLASASAGDDVAIRARGAVSITGQLSAGSGADSNGAADRLIASSESGPILAVADPDLSATPAPFDLTGGTVDIVAGGDLNLNSQAQASNLHLQSGGSFTAQAITASGLLFVRSPGVAAPGGDWTAKTLQIEASNPAGVAIGDGVTAPAGAFVLSNADFGKLQAGAITLFAGDTSGTQRGGALLIGKLDVNDATVGALNLFAGSSAKVTITGQFAPTKGATPDAPTSTVVRIGAKNGATGGNWTPDSILVENDGGGAVSGSIGQGTNALTNDPTAVRAFQSVQLNAVNNILFGTPDFVAKMADPATTPDQVAGISRLQGPVSGPGGPVLFLTAGSLTMRADGKLIQQDSSGFGVAYTGMFLTGAGVDAAVPSQALVAGPGTMLTIGRTDGGLSAGSPSATPAVVELYLNLRDPNGAIYSGTNVALAPRIGFEPGTGPFQLYHVNSCVIGEQGVCTPLSNPSTNIRPNDLTAGSLPKGVDLPDVEDSTVTGAANEEIWRKPE